MSRNRKRRGRVTPAQLERALGVLGNVSAWDESLNGHDRDEISHVIDMLDRLIEHGGLVQPDDDGPLR